MTALTLPRQPAPPVPRVRPGAGRTRESIIEPLDAQAIAALTEARAALIGAAEAVGED